MGSSIKRCELGADVSTVCSQAESTSRRLWPAGVNKFHGMAAVLVLLTVTLFSLTAAADVVTQLSSQEAYVGSPVTLYVQVSGRGVPATLETPQVDGLDIRSSGTPRRSSRISIINGRRSESSSVTYTFEVTPQREGTFQIPSFQIKTGSGIEQTKPVRLSATTSETGDLMFAEIEGDGQKVYVGQPIDSKLKIWIKPFVDPNGGIKLSPGQMWQLMSEQSEWGGFQAKLEELAENRQAIRGREVLRKDEGGVERAYYLYEIDATIYPKTSGVLDAQDVQVVYRYPLALGQARDPFGSFFDDSSFGGSSLAKQFFGNNSPFGRSLTITDVRPIVVEPTVTDFEVKPIPSLDRPDDYRGAVGQYAIVTQASPSQVKAGDPITLQIGVRGTGPMELVQAPPLQKLAALTDDFKIADDNLAGVVQGDVKVFATTIRPRREGVSKIPAIPFSYFDPELEKFVTVKSEPISIEVKKAETLALDAIVGSGKSVSGPGIDTQNEDVEPTFQLDNSQAASVLTSSTATNPASLWWLALIPPGIWLGVLVFNRDNNPPAVARRKWLRKVREATTATALAETVQRVVQHGDTCLNNSLQRTTPAEFSAELRTQIEGLYQSCDQLGYGGSPDTLSTLKDRAKKIVSDLPLKKLDRWQVPKFERPLQKLALAGLIASLVAVAAFTFVELSDYHNVTSSAVPTTALVSIDLQQQKQLLSEASTAYVQGLTLATSDVAESKIAFASAAEKYQLLADSGIRNSELYLNLGNAFLQQDKLGNAIANFETARRLDPTNGRAAHNLELAKQRIAGDASTNLASSKSWVTALADAVNSVSPWYVWAVFGVAWLGFWLTAAIKLSNWSAFESWSSPLVGASAVVVFLACGWIVAQDRLVDAMRTPIAVVTDVAADVRSGAGDEFQAASGFELSEGAAWRVLQQRGDWCQVESNSGSTGWVKRSDVVVVPSV